jgi:hypothetical protein
MNTQGITEIRNLTSDEMEDASGALKASFGPLRVKLAEDGLFFSLGIDGVGSFNVDGGGIWGDWGGKGYSLP